MSNVFLSQHHSNKKVLLPRISSKKMLQKNTFHSNDTNNNNNNNNNKNQNNNLIHNNNNNKLILNSVEKKPGTSIDKRKPAYMLPKLPTKQLSNTANVKADNSRKNNNNFYYNKFMSQDNPNNYNDIGNINNNDNNDNNDNNNYSEIYEKKAIDLLNNDNELNNMFNEIYGGKNDEKYKKEWIEKHLFKREVFMIMLESYVKQNKDINSFIKNEISKILNNELLDNMVLKSFKQINFQYDDYINKIYNM